MLVMRTGRDECLRKKALLAHTFHSPYSPKFASERCNFQGALCFAAVSEECLVGLRISVQALCACDVSSEV